jgi:beta-lactamase class A
MTCGYNAGDRKKGKPNKRTQARQQAFAQAVLEAASTPEQVAELEAVARSANQYIRCLLSPHREHQLAAQMPALDEPVRRSGVGHRIQRDRRRLHRPGIQQPDHSQEMHAVGRRRDATSARQCGTDGIRPTRVPPRPADRPASRPSPTALRRQGCAESEPFPRGG